MPGIHSNNLPGRSIQGGIDGHIVYSSHWSWYPCQPLIQIEESTVTQGMRRHPEFFSREANSPALAIEVS